MENIIESVLKWVNAPLFHIGQTPVTLGGIASAFLIVFISFVLSGFVQRLIERKVSKKFHLTSGMSYAFQRILHYSIVLLGIFIATQCIGLNLGALAVVFGFMSVGIGFGLQNVTANFISGLILLLEQPVAVGDFVSVDDRVGTVKDIRMRSTVIETLDRVSIIVPNSKFIEGNVTNWSYGDTRVRMHCPVGVAYGSDVPLVKETLMKVAEENRDVLDNPAPEVRFLEFGNSSLNFELLVWISIPEKQFALHSHINYEIDAAFRAANVKIPFPQRDLHLQMSPAVEALTGR